jgi:pyruvate,water dikinase
LADDDRSQEFPPAERPHGRARTEGAQAAYPYYTQFVPGDDQKFWFYNSMHFPEPMHHFDMITAEAAYVALGAFNTRVHVLPTAKGIEHRVINGRVYIGGVAVTDPAEIGERVEQFQQRAFTTTSTGSGSTTSGKSR